MMVFPSSDFNILRNSNESALRVPNHVDKYNVKYNVDKSSSRVTGKTFQT